MPQYIDLQRETQCIQEDTHRTTLLSALTSKSKIDDTLVLYKITFKTNAIPNIEKINYDHNYNSH